MGNYHLGINLGHDRAAAIVRDGEIVIAIEQERLDRQKHSIGILQQSGNDPSHIQLPYDAVNYCLAGCGITMSSLSSVTANMPGIDYSTEILRRTLAPEWQDKIRQMQSHHLSHAYSAYWPSGFDRAIVLVADGVGTADTSHHSESYTLYQAEGTEITPIHCEKVVSHLAGLSTLGFLYEYVTQKAGFVSESCLGVNIPEPGKLMGLAPYGGEQRNWHRWIYTHTDSYSVTIPAYDIFLEIEALEKIYDDGKGKPYLRHYLVDMAWKIQKELEDALVHIAELAIRETGIRTMCLAGGVTLNSVMNYQLYRRLKLRDIFIFPAAGDAGIAAGCALWAYATQERGLCRPQMRSSTLGQTYTSNTVRKHLEGFLDQIDVEELTPAKVVERSAQTLAKGHIIARFEGGSEYGPRALGHRSILADPTFERMKDIINARVKFREPFRPFAPVIPLEDVPKVFEQEVPSPFMLMVSKIKDEYHGMIPSVTHYDGTGRVQTVTANDNPYLHTLCQLLVDARGGPPVVLNTSFNIAGQPIVETPEDAIRTFLIADIDYLCIDSFWITKKGVPIYDYDEHLNSVENGELPHGLAPDQSDVTDLMRKLDRAIFFNETDNCPWTLNELAELSAKGARYKETSILFKDTQIGTQLETLLSPGVVVLLNPMGVSELIDIKRKYVVGKYGYDDLLWLIVALNDPRKIETLRTHQQLTTGEATRRLKWASEQLHLCNIVPVCSPGESQVKDTLITIISSLGLESYADPEFSARAALMKVNTVLHRYEYTATTICRMLGIETLQRIEPSHLFYYDKYKLPESPLGDLIRLFQLRVALPKQRIRELFGEKTSEMLMELGVLIERNGQLAARVDLFDVHGLYIATDHRYMILEEDTIHEDPVMYIGDDSLGLVNTTVPRTVDSVLDLCTGSGVQALVASRYASRVTGVDINPRAIRFARFNAQLNGVENVEFKQGDLYDAVSDAIFDSIIANPPFVPSPAQTLKFRDGGTQGEDVLERIVTGASRHLTSEGTIYIVTDIVDLDSYREKLDQWWDGGGCDMLVLHTAARDEALFSIPHSRAPFGQTFDDYNAELAKWINNFRNASLTSVDFGYILIQRKPDVGNSTYYVRTIHNPHIPIYTQIINYFEQRSLLRGEKSGELYLRVQPGLMIRSSGELGSAKYSNELFIVGNPYFTTYLISDAMLERIEYVMHTVPRKQECGDWVDDLIFKGLMYLVVSPKETQYEHEIDIGRSANNCDEPKCGSCGIEELATKTTPTCLSSYIRR